MLLPPSPRLVLTMEELLAIQNVALPIDYLSEVRDVYIFSCYTGYSYYEVSMLTPDHVIRGMDGNKWISIKRHKTGEPEMVPLLPIPLSIIEQYKNHPDCLVNGKLLPVKSNTKYNMHLKQVAERAKVKKYLTTHTARHTFATTVTLEHDVPLETVSRLLGHRSIRTTQIYAKVSLKKLSNNINDLRQKLNHESFSKKTGT